MRLKMRDLTILKTASALIIMILTAMITSCSSGNPSTPKTPDENTIAEISEKENSSYPIALGEFDLTISDDLKSAELTLSRNADLITDSWTTEMVNFFRAVPCKDCFRVDGVSLDADNHVVLKIYARHPFPKGDAGIPPSGKNRDDLRVFDTKLVLVTRDNAGPSFDVFGKRLSSTIVVNADGYTDSLDSVYDPLGNKPDDTHPYIILFEDRSEGNVNPSSLTGFTNLSEASGHNVMNQATASTTDLVLDIESGKTHQFKVYITANYGISAQNFLQRLEPRYYIPEFNAKEAWKVEAIVESNSLGAGYADSMAEILVRVWDWQHDAKVDPMLPTLDSTRAVSGIAGVDVSIPGLFNGTVSSTKPFPVGTGKGDTPLEYRLEVYNTLEAPSGDYSGLVRVVDERQIGLNVSTPEDGIWNSGDGLFPFDIEGFRTYQYFEISFIDFWSVPPVARFHFIPSGDPLVIGREEEFRYDASESYDVDGGIFSYEWDFNYDRVTFNPTPGHTSWQGTYKYSSAGNYRVALRVKDNTIPQLNDITYKWITVLPEQQYIAPRRIFACDDDSYNLKFPAKRAVKVDEGNVFVVLGGTPYGERYIMRSTDYGANFSTPQKVSGTLQSNSTQHICGFDISSTGEVGYFYADENTVQQTGWPIVRRSSDGVTWMNQESLEIKMGLNYAADGEILYGNNDCQFLIFSMLRKDPLPASSSIYYFYRSTSSSEFQPLQMLVGSNQPPSTVLFHRPFAAVGHDGQIHVAYVTRITGTGETRYSANYVRLSADGSQITRPIVKISQTGTYDTQRFIDIAVDGDDVYVAFMQYDTLSQVCDLALVKSEDYGENWWQTPVIITDWQIGYVDVDHPVSISIDSNHRINLVWADDRQAGTTNMKDIWCDYSDDGGLTFNTDVWLYGEGIAGDQDYPSISIDRLDRIHLVWWNNDETAGKGLWHTRFRI